MLDKLLFIAACLLIPVIWGVFVNWMFDAWQARTNPRDEDDPIFPDYQI
jgi:hypothetical protein